MYKINFLILFTLFSLHSCEFKTCSNGRNSFYTDTSNDIKLMQNTDQESIVSDTSCFIDISKNSLDKEYNCSTFEFSYEDKSIFIDSNFDYTTVYYLIDQPNVLLKTFDRYDLPTGRRKLLLFNIINKEVFLSDWFDDSAIGDSIDIKSINFRDGRFKVWTSSKEIQSSYYVKLNILRSW